MKKILFGIAITAAVMAILWFGIKYYKIWKVGMASEDSNVQAFLKMIRFAENKSVPDADRYYRVYGNLRISDLSDHPVTTGEWMGEKLPDSYCTGAGFSPGCKTTAAGAYQFILPTWKALKAKYNLKSFNKEDQDKAAIGKIEEAGALDDVKAGRIKEATGKISKIWASLPGYNEGQPEVAMTDLLNVYSNNGGNLA